MEDKTVGCLLGLALGDAMGAPHEGGPIERAAWWLLGTGKRGLLRWTDDTEMALGLAESLAHCHRMDPDDAARRWAERFDWRRGYGAGARRLLARIRAGEDWRTANRAVFPDGSFGNGAAMRAAPIGVFFALDEPALLAAAAESSRVTHAHPLGIEGGVLMALSAGLAARGEADPRRFIDALLAVAAAPEFRTRLEAARGPLATREIQARLGSGVLAHESVVTAIHVFLHHGESFSSMMEVVVALGGDTDTIGAMAGGLFGALHGAGRLPREHLVALEAREEIEAAARALHAARPDFVRSAGRSGGGTSRGG